MIVQSLPISNSDMKQSRKFNGVLHIGTEKTGTSAIQVWLHLNRNKLNEFGYYFLQSPGKLNNRAVPACCIDYNKNGDDFFTQHGAFTNEDRNRVRNEFLHKLDEEITGLPAHIHTIVISSEHFHSRLVNQDEVDRLRNLLDNYIDKYQVICYLRNQVDCVISAYSTHLKSGNTTSLGDFIKVCNIENKYYNYHDMLQTWKQTFGYPALDISLFDKEMFYNRDLIDDFTFKLDPKLITVTEKPKELKNISLNLNGQIISRAISDSFPRFNPDNTVNNKRIVLQNIVSQHLSGRGEQPLLEDQQRIYDEFFPSNEMVRREYFPHLSSIFARPTSVKEAETATPEQLTKTIELMIGTMAGNTVKI
jgi:hypothetical protein